MNHIEAMKLALEALELHAEQYPHMQKGYTVDAITALRQALEQPEQESDCNPHPDAPHGFNRDASHSLGRYVCDCEGWEPKEQEHENRITSLEVRVAKLEKPMTEHEKQLMAGQRSLLRTAPPKREWVGLTDEERKQFSQWAHIDVVRHFEELLKERNR